MENQGFEITAQNFEKCKLIPGHIMHIHTCNYHFGYEIVEQLPLVELKSMKIMPFSERLSGLMFLALTPTGFYIYTNPLHPESPVKDGALGELIQKIWVYPIPEKEP